MTGAEIVSSHEDKMKKSLENLARDYSGLRTGRATTAILDNVRVEVYGQTMPLSGCASVTVQDARTLLVTVWDQANVKGVDASIRTSDLNLNPRLEGNKLFVVLPELTADRRNDLVKVVKKKCEDIKVVLRNIRRDANEAVKELEKKKLISQDDQKRLMEQIQKLCDGYCDKADTSAAGKTKDIMAI